MDNERTGGKILKSLSCFQLQWRVDPVARCVWLRLSVFWILEALGCPWVLMLAGLDIPDQPHSPRNWASVVSIATVWIVLPVGCAGLVGGGQVILGTERNSRSKWSVILQSLDCHSALETWKAPALPCSASPSVLFAAAQLCTCWGSSGNASSSPAWPSSPCVEHTSHIPVVWPACWSVGHGSGEDFFIFLSFFYFISFYRSQRKWAEFLRNSCQCVSWHIPCTTEVNTFIPIVPLYEKQHCLWGSFWFSELQILWAAQESWEPQKSSLWNEFWGVSVLIKCF